MHSFRHEVGNCLFPYAWGWGINRQVRKNGTSLGVTVSGGMANCIANQWLAERRTNLNEEAWENARMRASCV